MAEFDLEKECMNSVRDGISRAIKEKFTSSYNNPFNALIESAINANKSEVVSLVSNSIAAALAAEGFRDDIAASVRKKLAGILVQRFGGELEKQVNALKRDPTTHSRITVAIDDIIKSTAKA